MVLIKEIVKMPPKYTQFQACNETPIVKLIMRYNLRLAFDNFFFLIMLMEFII